MARLVWNQSGERFFEAGVDRAVFYPPGEAPAVWNGITNITERSEGGEKRAFYLNGVKYLEIAQNETFAGTIEAFSRPQGLSAYDGMREIASGLKVGQQKRRPFNFCYRTLVGNDALGVEHGYKIHLVYNALLGASETTRSTMNDSPEPVALSWDFTTTPVEIPESRPSSHIVAETTNLGLVTALENILYGTASTAPHFPTVAEVLALTVF